LKICKYEPKTAIIGWVANTKCIFIGEFFRATAVVSMVQRKSGESFAV
jgi:hypothetical protein